MLNQWIPGTASMVAGRGMRRTHGSAQRLRRRNVDVVDVCGIARTIDGLPAAGSAAGTRRASDADVHILQRD
jgi:hypothetical protein